MQAKLSISRYNSDTELSFEGAAQVTLSHTGTGTVLLDDAWSIPAGQTVSIPALPGATFSGKIHKAQIRGGSVLVVITQEVI